MQYIKYVFENEEVRNLTASNEETIANLVNEHINDFIATNFTYVVENMQKFVDLDNLEVSYENIKNFIIHDMLNMMSAVSEVAALDDNSFDHINAVMEENVSSVFSGVGYGTQKAQRLITSSYE